MKVYAKIRQNGEYHSQNISQAVYGFREMGAEIVRYQKISDIYESVTKEDIVLDYITQVEMILKKFGVVPACEDYPVELRKFMGRNVWKDTINSINTHPEKWGVCDVIAPKMEWRGFIIYDELVDIRPYRGDYHYHFDAEVVDQIVEAFRTIRERPMGGSLDFAVIEKNGKLQTVFLEMNDGYSLGSYGLVPIQYAKLVSARWSQLLNRTDEFDFRKMR